VVVVAAARGGGWRPCRAAARGVQQPLGLAEAKKSLVSDYHVSGDVLPHNWMIVLSHNGYII
jgi:hypothetical protein